MPRPKAFDPDVALQKAMQVFWERGYEATSVQDLVESMSINRFSLYNTFGDKHQLFVAVLERYCATIVADLVGELEQSTAGLAAIRQFFTRLVDFFASAKGWRGCLITNTVIELAPHDPQAAAKVQAYVVRLEEAFYRALLQAQQTQQLTAAHACRDLARFLTGAALGFGVLAKTSPGRQALEGYARVILSVLAWNHDDQAPPNPRADIPIAALFRFAVEDLKSYYCEALTAQPGQSAAASTRLADWFWCETTAGRVLFAVQEVCKQGEVPGMQVVANGFLIPHTRSAESPFARA